ncbi:hypothetical protein [Aestuariibacter salexigens]|uniref:HzsA-related protein n=1 Tax=Aestuariibacter salexigens TaxID=226010 RepID=UPI0003F90CC2|nr:hypothetical protein [Aestuariibacter salexigens]
MPVRNQLNSMSATRLSSVIALTMVLGGCGGSVVEQEQQEPDPVVVDIPIAYIKRTVDEDISPLIPRDLRDPTQFTPGATLVVKARASASALETNVTDRAFVTEEETENAPIYDVRDLETSYDGSKLLFAMRAPEEDGQDQEPTWNIWEYDLPSDTLRRVIGSDLVAEAGQDTGPVYLRDGRILFSSTRQRGNQARLLDEGKPQYSGLEESLRTEASVLHVMNSDGTGIEQVSFNQSHDLDPVVLSNGKVLFSRWDQAGGNKGIHLYTMNPDGSDVELLFGRHSHQQNGQNIHFIESRETPDENILVALREFMPQRFGGDYAILDTAGFTDINVPIASNPGGSGQAQLPALFDNIDATSEFSAGGYFASLYPLWDGSGRQLFSWSQCRVREVLSEESEQQARILPCTDEVLTREDIAPAAPLYGLWMYDPVENTQLPLTVAQEGIAITEVVAMESRPYPANAPQPEQVIELQDANLGLLHIRSVYDIGGEDTSPAGLPAMADPTLVSVAQRPARFLRISKAVSIPDDEVLDFERSAFGRSRANLMREIVGYVPIEPDGSALFQVPANIPLAISILDADGKRISPRHNNWIQVAAGEVKTCNGCHTPNSTVPHGRLDAESESVNHGAPASGIPFPNTNPSLFADVGETMAQVAARLNGAPYPSQDITFIDIWSDPEITEPAPSFAIAYQDLATPLPVSQNCAQNWTALCRIVVNFPQHIQPLFEHNRELRDAENNLIEDRTCVTCHAPQDELGGAQVPAGQLDLTGTPSSDNPDILTAYRELMFADNEQEVIDGVLIDRLIPVVDQDGNPVFETDEDGELILDAEGNPIPVMTTVRVGNSMNPNGSRSSQRFFNVFLSGAIHADWLSPVERKLFAEWLDIGGQYYNNPFDSVAAQ